MRYKEGAWHLRESSAETAVAAFGISAQEGNRNFSNRLPDMCAPYQQKHLLQDNLRATFAIPKTFKLYIAKREHVKGGIWGREFKGVQTLT